MGKQCFYCSNLSLRYYSAMLTIYQLIDLLQVQIDLILSLVVGGQKHNELSIRCLENFPDIYPPNANSACDNNSLTRSASNQTQLSKSKLDAKL